FLGTDVSGSTVVGGGSGTYGILQYGSSGNLIGGTSPDARNLIDGFGQGIASFIEGGPQEHEFVEGNFIGTDATGTKALGNAIGVRANYDYDWTITGNLISGNQIGIDGSFATEEIQGNLIGTDVTGKIALGNGTGVVVGRSGTVGGTTAAARNIISGN